MRKEKISHSVPGFEPWTLWQYVHALDRLVVMLCIENARKDKTPADTEKQNNATKLSMTLPLLVTI